MNSMIIAGGRDYRGTNQDFLHISGIIKQHNITEIVSGGQRSWDEHKQEYYGADYFGEQCSARLGIPVKKFEPDWDDITVPGAIVKYRRDGSAYNAKAGPDRNRDMAVYTDYVYLLPGGRGTDSMRRETVKAGKEILYDGKWV